MDRTTKDPLPTREARRGLTDPSFLPQYTPGNPFVVDPAPRTISNLIVDQTVSNPAAYAAAYDPGADGQLHTADDVLKAQAAMIRAMAAGEITPDEAATIAGVLDAKRKAIETVQLEERVAKLEQQSGARQ